LFFVGWFAWSLAEYMLHRFIFHWSGPATWLRRFHFVFHGVHHDFPSDDRRLVMPLGVSIPVFLVFFVASSAAFGVPITGSVMSGFGIGYLAYDGVHYFTHHMPMRSRLGKFLKRYHMVHHFTGHDAKWGVSSPLWDYAFRSAEER
jgi:sterol desaturase/sphingolipid hydroxylase (fatty acid hydroxylase superfamily)